MKSYIQKQGIKRQGARLRLTAKSALAALWRHRVMTALLLIVCVFGAEFMLLKIPRVQAAYTVANSARFVSGNNDYLSKTLTTPTNNKKWTVSVWVKRAAIATTSNQTILKSAAGGDSAANDGFRFEHDTDIIRAFLGGAVTADLQTTAVFRDPSAWLHVVEAVDTTQATASNRIKLYVNGVQITSFGTATYPTQNYNTAINSAVAHTIGAQIGGGGENIDAYMSDYYFIDGAQLAASCFGQTDSNGYWRPIAYSTASPCAAYGTDGFHLAFGTGSSLGTDTSGNSNNFTVNGLTSADQMIDTPTNSFATGNSIATTTGITLTSGNLVVSAISGQGWQTTVAPYGMSSGKWYWEVTPLLKSTVNDYYMPGIANSAFPAMTNGVYPGIEANSYGYFGANGWKYYYSGGATAAAYGAAYTVGDVIGVAYDADAGSLTFYKNGTSQGAAFTGLTGTWFPATGVYDGSSVAMNYGQGGAATTTIYLTSGTTWTVPNDWSSVNTIEVIGGGAGGMLLAGSNSGGGGGGGGAYSKISNLSLTPAGSVTYQVGSGGSGGTSPVAGGDTYFNGSGATCAAQSVCAQGGAVGSASTGGAGGASGSGVGTTKNSGGTGGNGATGGLSVGGGGAGAAGPAGAGGNGGNANGGSSSGGGGGGNGGGTAGQDGQAAAGGAGGNNSGGNGGGAGATTSSVAGVGTNGGGGGGGIAGGADADRNGAIGGTGIEWDATHGSGGGGGGAKPAASASAAGGNGALYGGGGGGSNNDIHAGSTAGNGAQGIVVIRYAPTLTFSSGAGGSFKYAPPSGYKALSTNNLPAPTIAVPKNYFDGVRYTGTGATQTVLQSGIAGTITGFTPDLVWIKDRTSVMNHALFDSARGVQNWLSSNLTSAEVASSTTLTAFASNGFTLGAATDVNKNGDNFISWLWKKSPTVDGVDIVTYTGDDTANRNISHSLGAAPDMVIVKRRNSTGDWYVWTSSMSTSSAFTLLDDTVATSTTNSPWCTACASSNWGASTFRVTNNATNNTNATSGTYVAYLFKGISGFSSFGIYTGNGSTDGPFVYTGFKPKFVMIKRTDAAGGAVIPYGTDATYNGALPELYPSLTNAEAIANRVDFLASGFKARFTGPASNANGGQYIYAAFAEQPFYYSAQPAASSFIQAVAFLMGMTF